MVDSSNQHFAWVHERVVFDVPEEQGGKTDVAGVVKFKILVELENSSASLIVFIL